MKIIIICLISIIIIQEVITFAMWMMKRDAQHKREKIMITTLQEVAYDYRVRVVINGFCRLTIDGKDVKISDLDISGHCIEGGYSYTDGGDIYIIIFRVFGKYYLAYSSNPLMSWRVVVQKAREENRKLFSRSNYYDRNKI